MVGEKRKMYADFDMMWPKLLLLCRGSVQKLAYLKFREEIRGSGIFASLWLHINACCQRDQGWCGIQKVCVPTGFYYEAILIDKQAGF